MNIIQRFHLLNSPDFFGSLFILFGAEAAVVFQGDANGMLHVIICTRDQ